MTMEIHNAYKYKNYYTNNYSISPFLIKNTFSDHISTRRDPIKVGKNTFIMEKNRYICEL